MRRLRWLTTTLLVGFLPISFAGAQIPQLIRYQGTLVDANNVPLEGSVTLTFRLYDVATGGTAVWSETQTAIPVSRGVFNVLLGSVTTLALPFDKDYWLSTQVNTDAEMSPRQQLTSVPYAYRAKVAEQLAEQPAGFAVDTTGTLANGLVTYWKLDEASGSRADSKGTNVLTDNNTVTQAAGKKGTAAQFTVANREYLSIPDNDDLSAGAGVSFTIAGWIYFDSIGGDARFLAAKYDFTTNNREWNLEYNGVVSNRFNLRVSANGTVASADVTANNFGVASVNTWYFVVAWHDAVNDEIGISINNGTPNTAAYSGDVFNGNSIFEVGANVVNAGYHNGRIDEVGFWKRVLTAQERADLYNAGNGNTHLPGGFYAGSLLTGKRYRLMMEEVL